MAARTYPVRSMRVVLPAAPSTEGAYLEVHAGTMVFVAALEQQLSEEEEQLQLQLSLLDWYFERKTTDDRSRMLQWVGMLSPEQLDALFVESAEGSLSLNQQAAWSSYTEWRKTQWK